MKLERILREHAFRRRLEEVAQELQLEIVLRSPEGDVLFRSAQIEGRAATEGRPTGQLAVGHPAVCFVECRSLSGDGELTSLGAKIVSGLLLERLRIEKEIESLSEELAERYEEIHLLHDLNEALGAVLEVERVCQIALDFALRAIPARRASVMLHDKNADVLRIAAYRGLDEEIVRNVVVRPGEGISGYVFEKGQSLVVEDLRNDPELARRCNGSRDYSTASFLSLPLLATPVQLRGEKLGVINLADRTDGAPFTTSDLKTLRTIASVTAIAIHNCYLVEQAKATEAFRKEMEIAKTIQQSLLPRSWPKIPGGEIAGLYQQARTVGGDYYDLYRDETDLMSIVIADVSGHDIGSALLMVEARSVIRAEISRWRDPAEVLQGTNRVLFEDLEAGGLFVSAFCARLDLSTWILEYANAGHCLPIWLDGQSGAIRRLDADGMIIGIWPEVDYEKREIQLAPGDVVLFFTDGVSEAKNAAGEQFGEGRLEQLIQRCRDLTAEQICLAIRKQLQEFTGNAGFADDITVVVLKRENAKAG